MCAVPRMAMFHRSMLDCLPEMSSKYVLNDYEKLPDSSRFSIQINGKTCRAEVFEKREFYYFTNLNLFALVIC
jgi:hypothetical protein